MVESTVLGFTVTLALVTSALGAKSDHETDHEDLRSKLGSEERRGGPQNGTQGPRKQNSPTDKIEKFQAMLKKVGPESRIQREIAVASLSGMSELKAHLVLQEYVVPGPDPDGLRRHILGGLPARLQDTESKAFHGPASPAIRQSYVAPLVKHFSGAAVAKVVAPQVRTLRHLARRALIAMNTQELRKALGVLLSVKSVETRRQALRATGQCQDLGLAPLIAAALDLKELRPVAREALYDLTYEDFADRPAFVTWYANNREKNYLELAEDAAREAKIQLAKKEAEQNARYTAGIVEFVDVLATSNRPDRWKRVADLVFPEPNGIAPDASEQLTRACLVRLRDVLAKAEPVQRDGDATERLAFFDQLVQRVSEKPAPIDHALVLEVASYLCVPGEKAQRESQQKLLLAGLAHASPEVQRGALRGMRRFFAPATRRAIVDLVREAQSRGDVATLKVAVETLQSTGWSAPEAKAPDAKAWVHGLYAILVDNQLPVDLRKEVIPVLCLSDANGAKLPRSFELLLEEASREQAHLEVRQSVMLRLPSLIPTEPGARDTAAERYLEKLVGLQSDKVDIGIRRVAATLLVVPPNVAETKQQALGLALARDIGKRLLEEKDERVFGALVASLSVQSGIPGVVSTVNSRLRKTLAVLGGGQEETKALAAAVVKGLKDVAVKKGRSLAEWTAACEALVKHNDRQSARSILDFHLRDTLGRQLPQDQKELVHRVWKLVVQTARLAPESTQWNNPVHRGEAELVNEAFRVLIADGVYAKAKGFDNAKTRLVYLRCLGGVGSGAAAKLTEQAEVWLKDKVLVGRDRDEARLLLARGYLAQSKPMEAWSTSGMKDVKGELLADRLELQTEIAGTFRSQKNVKDAEALLRSAVALTPADAPAKWPRLRAHIEVRFEMEPKQGAALVQELDKWATGMKLTEDQEREVASLKATLQGTARPQR